MLICYEFWNSIYQAVYVILNVAILFHGKFFLANKAKEVL